MPGEERNNKNKNSGQNDGAMIGGKFYTKEELDRKIQPNCCHCCMNSVGLIYCCKDAMTIMDGSSQIGEGYWD